MMEETKEEESNGEFEIVRNPTDKKLVSTGDHMTETTGERVTEATVPSEEEQTATTSSLFSSNDQSNFPVGTGAPPVVPQSSMSSHSVPYPGTLPQISDQVSTQISSPTVLSSASLSPSQQDKFAPPISTPKYYSPGPGYVAPVPQVMHPSQQQMPGHDPGSVVQPPQPVSPYAQTPIVQAPGSYAADTALVLPGDYFQPQVHDPTDDGSMWGWFKGTVSQIAKNDVIHKVVEKTRSSVDSMITTLDPQMREYMREGGEMDIVVTSDKDIKVSPVRKAFQDLFGKAVITGVAAQSNIAPQPVGFSAGMKGAEERIDYLLQNGLIHEKQPVISIENFIAELTPDRWYDIGCIILQDRGNNINLQTYSQAVPVPIEFVQLAQDETPSDYGLRWSGLSITIGHIMQRNLPHVDHVNWHKTFTGGVSREDMLYLAVKTLAGMYRQRLGL